MRRRKWRRMKARQRERRGYFSFLSCGRKQRALTKKELKAAGGKSLTNELRQAKGN